MNPSTTTVGGSGRGCGGGSDCVLLVLVSLLLLLLCFCYCYGRCLFGYSALVLTNRNCWFLLIVILRVVNVHATGSPSDLSLDRRNQPQWVFVVASHLHSQQ